MAETEHRFAEELQASKDRITAFVSDEMKRFLGNTGVAPAKITFVFEVFNIASPRPDGGHAVRRDFSLAGTYIEFFL